jgi:hypothetical protein
VNLLHDVRCDALAIGLRAGQAEGRACRRAFVLREACTPVRCVSVREVTGFFFKAAFQIDVGSVWHRSDRRRAALRQELRAPGRSLGFFGKVANIVEGKYPISYDLRSRSSMGIFLASATSVVVIRLLPFMLADGHVIAAMTRTQGKAP